MIIFITYAPLSQHIRYITANASPNITVDSIVNAMVGQEYVLTVTTSDQDGDEVTLNLMSALPGGATFANGVYTWTPANTDAMTISYVVIVIIYIVFIYPTLNGISN